MQNSILKNLGFERLTDMQHQMSDAFLADRDIVLLSPTGSGKTVGFLYPLALSLKKEVEEIQVLIISPTRELAIQIEDVFKKMRTGFKVNTCYGGHSVKTEINNLSEPPAVLIGTPGRIDDLIRRKVLNLRNVSALVLDEFDKSLQLGFHEEMRFIIQNLSHLDKQILTSATDLKVIPDFIKLNKPLQLNFLEKENKPATLELRKVVSEEKDKLVALLKLICKVGDQTALVFLNHRESIERTSHFLEKNKIVHGVYHGGMDQSHREKALTMFRNGSIRILVTTDLAARGLDIPEIRSVIHYHLPLREEEFIHRNGRTARMNASGTAYILISEEEKVPAFIDENMPEEKLSDDLKLPADPDWETLYVGKGKKDKINKVDIVGFLHQKGKLNKEEVGLIEVKDTFAFVAIRRNKSRDLLELVKFEKLKGMKVKLERA